MKKYFCCVGVLLLAGALLWANAPENHSLLESLRRHREKQIRELEDALFLSQKRCNELESENRNLKERFESLGADIASVERALDLPERNSEEPDCRLQDILSRVENYYIPTSTKKLKLLSEEDWELIDFSLEEKEEARERIHDYEKFVKKYSGKKIIILED